MNESPTFADFDLAPAIRDNLNRVGYETPTPIQAQSIPLLLQGRDLLGQAQTGTGKTAAFALPLLSRLEPGVRDVQLLVLAPTRELAIQVAEAFQTYAAGLPDFHVLPIYGGSEYGSQIRALKRGVQVVVGTPGRVMDHMRKGTLKLDNLKALVLDEADEMLRMGFIDDVEWILERTPEQRQVALFSATMPKEIRRIATTYLNNPEQVTIQMKVTTAETIRQRFWPVKGTNKLDALTRILEVEEFDAMIIFVRTKTSTVELADKLEARGFAAAALNGDIAQNQRERTVDALKKGRLDILVATDVAARGLDVERISHVVNYDIPYDTEAYVHRIGRTGRAGRQGDAILFVAPREKRLLAAIERATRQRIEIMDLPSHKQVNEKRQDKFFQRITDTLEAGELDYFEELVSRYSAEQEIDPARVAAALAKIAQGNSQVKPVEGKVQAPNSREDWDKNDRRNRDGDKGERKPRREKKPRGERDFDVPMETFRIEVGHEHKVSPSNIVGAIANETDIDSQYIGRIDIRDSYSLVDLPAGMPKDLFNDLKTVWVSGQQLKISHADESGNRRRRPEDKEEGGKPGRPEGKGKAAENRPPRGRKPNDRRSFDGKPGGRKPSKRRARD